MRCEAPPADLGLSAGGAKDLSVSEQIAGAS